MKGEWRSAPRGGCTWPILQDFGMSFQLSPHVRLTPCVRTRGSLQFRHRALSSAHGAKHGSDSQHGGGGNDSTIVVIGPQARGDKGCLVSVSLGAPRAGRHLSPLLPVALLAQALLDGYLGENALRFCEHQRSPHPPSTICHEVGGDPRLKSSSFSFSSSSSDTARPLQGAGPKRHIAGPLRRPARRVTPC